MSEATGVRCSCCGELIALDEAELAFRAPDAYHALDADAKARPDTFCDGNFCVVAGATHFVRGLIPLPVHGADEAYCIGAWFELDAADWQHVRRMWDEYGNDALPPLRGRLANALPHHVPSTLGLAVDLQPHDETRPTARVVDPAHPLAQEQAAGISAHRARGYTPAGRPA
ncbi:DUF2199 domain-containing protein [Lysobacter humi (ex Lee et al. 2017)]